MPAESLFSRVAEALATFGTEGGSREAIALEAGVSAKTARKHLKTLEEAQEAVCSKEEHPPFRQVWRAA